MKDELTESIIINHHEYERKEQEKLNKNSSKYNTQLDYKSAWEELKKYIFGFEMTENISYGAREEIIELVEILQSQVKFEEQKYGLDKER